MAPTVRKRYNNLLGATGAKVELAALLPAEAGPSTITFASALQEDATNLSIADPDYVPLVISPDSALAEIVWLIAYTAGATTGTVLRAQEQSSVHSHGSGSLVVHGPTVLDIEGGAFEPVGTTATHSAVTTSVHGIADTSLLETTAGATSKVAAEASIRAAADTAHETDSTAAHAASAVSFTPAGGISGTTVQAAIVEAAALPTPITGPTGATGATGATGPAGTVSIYISDTAPATPAVNVVWIDTGG